MIVWLPAALIVWCGLRSSNQDYMSNPNFPVMAPRETPVPLFWLAGYVIFIPLLQYQWVRYVQPVKAPHSGVWVGVAGLAAVFVLVFETFRTAPWLNYVAGVAAAVCVIVLFRASWRLHRTMEVQA